MRGADPGETPDDDDDDSVTCNRLNLISARLGAPVKLRRLRISF